MGPVSNCCSSWLVAASGSYWTTKYQAKISNFGAFKGLILHVPSGHYVGPHGYSSTRIVTQHSPKPIQHDKPFDKAQAPHTKPCHTMLAMHSLGLVRRGEASECVRVWTSKHSQTCTNHPCHPNTPLFLKNNTRSGYYFCNHYFAVAKMQFDVQFLKNFAQWFWNKQLVTWQTT